MTLKILFYIQTNLESSLLPALCFFKCPPHHKTYLCPTHDLIMPTEPHNLQLYTLPSRCIIHPPIRKRAPFDSFLAMNTSPLLFTHHVLLAKEQGFERRI